MPDLIVNVGATGSSASLPRAARTLVHKLQALLTRLQRVRKDVSLVGAAEVIDDLALPLLLAR